MAKNVKPALPFLRQEFSNLQDEVCKLGSGSAIMCYVLSWIGWSDGPQICPSLLLLWWDGVHLSPRLPPGPALLHCGEYHVVRGRHDNESPSFCYCAVCDYTDNGDQCHNGGSLQEVYSGVTAEVWEGKEFKGCVYAMSHISPLPTYQEITLPRYSVHIVERALKVLI